MFINLLIILFSIAISFIAIVWLFVEMGWGFFRPKNNIEYVVLRGEIFDHSIRDGINCLPKKLKDGTIDQNKEDPPHWLWLWIYHWFGIRYFGIPGIYKLGKVVVNYPSQLKSTSGAPHATENDIAPGFTVHRNYLVEVEADFQGGISFKMQFNLEVLLKLSIVAWGRIGKFLAPIGQYIEGAVNAWSISTNPTQFIGLAEKPEEAEAAKQISERLRQEICQKIMELTANTNKGNAIGGVVPIRNLCGYEILSISFKNIEPSNDQTREWLALLKKQSESIVKTKIAQQEAKTATAEATGAAAKIKIPGMAQAKVDQALGMANAVVLEAERKAAGPDFSAVKLAEAIKETKVTTLVIGGDKTPPVILNPATK